eukprot:scaffold83390_cov31-Tisochrysis_lutea.AAC.2
MMELNDSIIVMTLLGGLKHPIACSIGSVLYCIGLVLYQRVSMSATAGTLLARHTHSSYRPQFGVPSLPAPLLRVEESAHSLERVMLYKNLVWARLTAGLRRQFARRKDGPLPKGRDP